MSTELATTTETALTVLPPQQAPSVVARQMLMAHGEMMQTAHQLATAICNTQMVPVRFRGKADDAAAAILYGAEIGLTPIQSMQRIISIHGMPSLEARTMVALLKARGYRIQTVAKSDDSVTVAGTSPTGEAAESTWTLERAKRAGYVPEIDEKTKKYKLNANGRLLGNEKYITDPQAMLTAKAQAEVCRELAPDVLMGISYTSEELESERFDDSALPPAPTAPRASTPVSVDDILDVEVDKPKRTRKPKASEAPLPSAEQIAELAEIDREVEKELRPAARQERAEAIREAKEQLDADASDSGAKVDTAQVSDAASDLRKSARGKLTGAIFSMFGDVGLSEEKDREDRLIVTARIVGRTVKSSNELTDDELQNLRNSLYSRQQAGTLDADINDWLNEAALIEANAQEAAESAAAEATTTTEEGK